MGNFTTKIKNDKAELVSFVKQKNKILLTSEKNPILIRYKNYLNEFGFYTVKLNPISLKNKMKDLFDKTSIKIKSNKSLPKEYIKIRNFIEKDIIDMDTDKDIGYYLQNIIGGLSSFGFFTVLENDKHNYVVQEKRNASILFDTQIVIPKILFTEENDEFMEYLSINFIKTKQNFPSSTINLLKSILPNLFKGVSEKAHSDIRFVNAINMLFEITIGLSIISLAAKNKNYNNDELNYIAGELLGNLFNYIKDDSCVDKENSVLEVDKSICEDDEKIVSNIIPAQKCNECKPCAPSQLTGQGLSNTPALVLKQSIPVVSSENETLFSKTLDKILVYKKQLIILLIIIVVLIIVWIIYSYFSTPTEE
jgi:hypothetical protein